MLEFTVPEKFEAEAQTLLGEGVRSFSEKTFPDLIEQIANQLRGDHVAEKLSSYAITFNKDGTTEVGRGKDDFRNGNSLYNFFDHELDRAIMVSNEQGETLCIAPFLIGGERYFKTFKPEEAEAFRESLAQVKEPKEPSAFDKFCNWCAEKFLHRPGKAVQAYKEEKAYYDAMHRLAETVGSIPEKVEEYKQGAEEQKAREEDLRQEQERQRELERQIELEKQRIAEENRLKQEEEARLKAQEEERRKQEELEKQRMEKERMEQDALKKVIEAESLKKAVAVEDQIDAQRLKMVNDAVASIPKKERELETLNNQRKTLKEKNISDEKNLNSVKDHLKKQENWLKQNENDLTQSKKDLADLKKDLKEHERLKDVYEKIGKYTKELNDANDAIKDVKQRKKEAEAEYKKAADEYSKISSGGHVFIMKPEEYLEYIYNQAKAGREKIHEQERAGLAAQMKEIADQIEVRNASKQKIKDEAKVWDYLPGIRGFRQKAQFMDKEDALKADLEKQYKELQKQDQELQKAFNEREAEHKKLALDFSPDNLKRTAEYLQNGLTETKAKHEAFKDAGKRVDELGDVLSEAYRHQAEAKRELGNWNAKTDGKKYDPTLHTRTQEVVNNLDAHIKELPRQILNIKSDVEKTRTLVRDSEFTLNENKESVTKMDKRALDLEQEVARGRSNIQNFTPILRSHGYTVELPPNLEPPKMPQINGKMPNQPQQPQNKPQGMGIGGL